VPRWQSAPGLSYRAEPCSDRDKKSGFWAGFRATGFLDIYRSPRVGLGYGWTKVNVERTMRCGGEIVRGYDGLVGPKILCLHFAFLIIRLLISIMQFVLCILLFDFVISVMYLYNVLVDSLVYAWVCVVDCLCDCVVVGLN
jgi:hypothetical protein